MKNESTIHKKHDDNEQLQDDAGADIETEVADSNVRVVTICELGRLVLQEYTKRDFWISFIEKVGGVEAIVLGGMKRIF